MKTKFLIGAFAFLMALGFTACDDSSSASSDSGTTTTTEPGDGAKEGSKDADKPGDVCATAPEEGCNFKKEDKVWKFFYSGSSFVHIYTWVDDSTVEYKECMNSYHMDRDDKTYTDANRDELFQQAMDECTP
jgi:hypothetical protein